MALQDIVLVSYSQRLSDAQIILDEINLYRSSKGVSPVKYSATLSEIVQKESDRLVTEESIYHTNNFLNDPRASGYSSASEVIALSYARDVKALVNWWIGSVEHERAISDPRHSVIGIGITYVDGSLTNTGQGWSVLSTVNLYGYPVDKEPSDTSASVVVTSAPAPTVNPVKSVVINGFTVQNAILDKFNLLGGVSVLGNPTMNENCTLIGGGCFQEFNLNGNITSIMWLAGVGARSLKYFSDIGQAWRQGGREHTLGFPAIDELSTGNGFYQEYSNGYKLYSARVKIS